MAIAYRAKTTGDIHGVPSTSTITKPAGTQATDILIVTWSGGTETAPAGWTPIATGVGSGTMKTGAWWALGSVTNLTFTSFGGSALDFGWVCAAYSGVNNTTPIDATGTTAASTGSLTVTAPAVTVVTSGAWEIIAVGVWNAATLSATGFTVADNSPVSNQQAGMLYNSTPKGTGSTGTVSVAVNGSASGQELTAIPFALRPDGAGGPAGFKSWYVGGTLLLG